MPADNSTNPARGAAFVELVSDVVGSDLGIHLDSEVPLAIGMPAKDHKFDLVNVQARVVIECKAYTWTESGNIPSAKITTAREAIFYLQWLPAVWTKALAMTRSNRPGYTESLAEYFVRLNEHLLGDIVVVEVFEQSATVLRGRWPNAGIPAVE